MSHVPPPDAEPDVHTIFVVGDLHGFLSDATSIFVGRIGARESDWLLPAGVAVIQVGDVIHKGPDSVELLDQIGRAMAANGPRWVQLWGNHESSVLQGSPATWRFAHPEPLAVVDVLEHWWRTGSAVIAHAVNTVELGEVLFTHAGLSIGRWRQLGSPATASDAAGLLNAPLGVDVDDAFGRGRILDSGAPHAAAGPVWNDTAAEGWRGWLHEEAVPFSQVHGHAAPWSWRFGFWLPHSGDLATAVALDAGSRRASLTLPGGQLISVDTAPQAALGVPGDPVLQLTVQPSPIRAAELVASASR